jgi:cytochrome c-type biogenesis protein CcmH/NrfF
MMPMIESRATLPVHRCFSLPEWKIFGCLLVLCWIFSVPAAYAQQNPHAKELAKSVKCMCGGCEDSAGLCSHPGGSFSGPCETARAMQKDLDDRVAKHQSDDAILAAYVTQYGPTVLVEPPKKGFDLLAWIMPVVMPLLALLLVWYLVHSWRKKAQLTPAGGPPVDPEFLARAQRESGKGAVE